MGLPNKGDIRSRATEDLLTCAVCLEIYSDPKVLDCLHSFCKGCLEQIHGNFNRAINCPLCKRQTPLNGFQGIRSLPNDFRIQKLKELYLQDSSDKDDESVHCNVCSNGAGVQPQAAKFHCQKCMVLYCQECMMKHNDNPVFSAHSIRSLSEDLASNSTPFCAHHPRHLVMYLCRTCEPNPGLCSICILGHNRSHITVEITESAKLVRDDLQKHLRELNTFGTKLQLWLVRSDEFVKCYDMTLIAAQEGISKAADAAVKRVNEEKKRLLQIAQRRVEGLKLNIDQAAGATLIAESERVRETIETILNCWGEVSVAKYQELQAEIKHLLEATPSENVSPVAGIQFIAKTAMMKGELGSLKYLEVAETDDEA